MSPLELVRELESLRAGQSRTLYRRGDNYVVISTVASVSAGLDPAARAIIDMGALLGGYATSGEETMAFVADEHGEVLDWCEIASSTGNGSREDVLEQLAS